jgi:predicted transposase YdaD
MLDTAGKFLIEAFSADFATWLLGQPMALIELSPTELFLEPIRADALILRQVATQTEPLPNRRDQSNVAASTAISAGLLLETAIIQRILRQEMMQDSVIYQDIKAEGRQDGLQVGR